MKQNRSLVIVVVCIVKRLNNSRWWGPSILCIVESVLVKSALSLMMGPQQVSSLSLAIGDKDVVGDQRNVRIKDKDNLLINEDTSCTKSGQESCTKLC